MQIHRIALSIVFITGALSCAPTLFAQQFVFSIEPTTIFYDEVTGVGSGEVVIRLREEVPAGALPEAAHGFSLSFSHDRTLVLSDAVQPAGVALALNGGLGPDLQACSNYLSGGQCGWVFDTLGLDNLEFPTDLEIARVTLHTLPGAWAGNSVGGSVLLSSAPPVEDPFTTPDVVVVLPGGTPLPAGFEIAPITLLPAPPSGFLRGDANLDGGINIADSIQILNGLFDPSVDLVCPIAADANDDEQVNIADPIYLLNANFGGPGAPPPPPFPTCGDDPTPGNLTCDQFSC